MHASRKDRFTLNENIVFCEYVSFFCIFFFYGGGGPIVACTCSQISCPFFSLFPYSLNIKLHFIIKHGLAAAFATDNYIIVISAGRKVE